jgi:aspartyl-tRNA(Asn)/glutamyl-tRNA(Gln) amidotransferase subunit A
MPAMTSDLPRTITEAARLIEARALSPVELVRALLERTEMFDPVISSFLTVTADEALAQARHAESEIANGRYRGALHGIPFGAKDNYETRGIRTTGHSRVYEHYVPSVNAGVIDQLHAEGAVLMGKLALHELAHGGPSFDLPWPPARNPWNPAHFTGGSSSGSAAALAAGLVHFSLGSDTGGSIRTPASLCGLVGLKPTFGSVSRYGVIPNSWSLDHCGPLTKSVEDCAIVMDAICGQDPRDRWKASRAGPSFRAAIADEIKGVRVGVVRHFWEEEGGVNSELAHATEEALRVMRALGATLETVRLRPVRDYCDVWTIIEAPETFSIQRKALAERPHEFGSVFLERTLIACLIGAADYMDAQRMRERMIEEMEAVWDKYDVLITAGAGPAPPLGPTLAKWPSLNRYSPFALLGVPAVVVPSGYSREGLPLSIQLVARAFDDARLLRVAHAYERATRFAEQREPDLSEAARPKPIAPPNAPGTDASARISSLCEQAASGAGLTLTDEQLAILCNAAPHLIEMVQRVRGAAGPAEPAGVFRL